MRKNSADLDGAGRADVGHGAGVGDLVEGDHQLEVGDQGHVQLVVGDQGQVQLKNRKIGDIIHKLTMSANLNLNLATARRVVNCAYTECMVLVSTTNWWLVVEIEVMSS